VMMDAIPGPGADPTILVPVIDLTAGLAALVLFFAVKGGALWLLGKAFGGKTRFYSRLSTLPDIVPRRSIRSHLERLCGFFFERRVRSRGHVSWGGHLTRRLLMCFDAFRSSTETRKVEPPGNGSQ
jgi:hypothetical protein